MLIKLSQNQLNSLEIYKYIHQGERFVKGLEQVDFGAVVREIYEDVRVGVERVRKWGGNGLVNVQETKDVMKLDHVIKLQAQPVEKLYMVNKKLCQQTSQTITIQKHTISKHFDYIHPITLPNKRQILLTFSQQTMNIYTHKLTLHSYRQFYYTKIIDVKQIGKYVIIAEKNKISRVNLGNLSQIAVRGMGEDVVGVGEGSWQGCFGVGLAQGTGRVAFLEIQNNMNIVTTLQLPSRPRRILILNQQTIIIALNMGLKLFHNLTQIPLPVEYSRIHILQLIQMIEQLILITPQSHIYTINIKQINIQNQNENQNQNININNRNGNGNGNGNEITVKPKRINQNLTKIIKSVAYNGYQIYCLGEAGNRIYVHSL